MRGLEDRGATLLGLDAGVRGAAGDRDVVVGDALARADDVAVRARALEDQHRVMVGRQGPNDRELNGEPISSSGFATNVTAGRSPAS